MVFKLKVAILIFLALTFSASSTAEQKYEFESMFAGLSECRFPNIKVDLKNGKANSSYLESKKLNPYKTENDVAYFKASENLFGLHVTEFALPISSYYAYVIYLEGPFERAEKILSVNLKNGVCTQNKVEKGEFCNSRPFLQKVESGGLELSCISSL